MTLTRSGIPVMEYRIEEVNVAVKKFAISVPQDVMDAVDQAAQQQGLSRSAFVALMLRRVAKARTDAEYTRRINAVFDDAQVADEQRSTAQVMGRRALSKGTSW